MDSYNNKGLFEVSEDIRKRREQTQVAPIDKTTEETTQAKDPKEFGLKDNIKEVGDAIVGGGIDIYNSVASLPKLLDKKFYQPTDPNNPYKYDAPWLIKNAPITETRWGKFLRTGIEFVGGTVGAGKIMWGAKGLKGIAAAAKLSSSTSSNSTSRNNRRSSSSSSSSSRSSRSSSRSNS